jgi:hypothetical protein
MIATRISDLVAIGVDPGERDRLAALAAERLPER